MLPMPLTSKTKKLKPIIKWTGGKYEEFSSFRKYIPPFEKYVEPFFGGGGVFFALQPKGEVYLNDKSKDLAQFYSLLSSPAFKQQLLAYADAWESAGSFSKEIIAELLKPFDEYVKNEIDAEGIKKVIARAIDDYSIDQYEPLFSEAFIIHKEDFIKKLKASLVDKTKRIKDICKKENRLFASSELKEHIETGVKGGLYLYLRGLMNKHSLKKIRLSDEKAIATWYFVREFCYASMFRYNSKGEFNIPYGGIAYNRKNFRQKVDNIFSEEIQHVFRQVKFYNLDFEAFIKKLKLTQEDFIFLDPPYDSEFSEYDQNAFTKTDQVRLRDVLINTKAKWMLVIKGTDFIQQLYTHPACNILEFDKTYTYNVRGRNNRDTKHLIITNYTVDVTV